MAEPIAPEQFLGSNTRLDGEAPAYVLRHAREWEELRLIVPAAQAFLALCASH